MSSSNSKTTTKRAKRRLKKFKQQERRRIDEIRRQKRYSQERRQLTVKVASTDPQPAPRGAAYFVTEIWQKLELDSSLDKVGIFKEGLAYSTTFLLVIMMGITGAPSLNQLAALVPQDLTIMTIFTLQQLDENQLYRGLSSVEIPQYKAWTVELLRALQENPLTVALKNGVVSGDTTQIAKPYAKKMPGITILYSHTHKRFIRGMEAITTHYSDDEKDYPLNFDFYQPNPELQAKRQEEKKRQKEKINARKPAQVLEYLKKEVKAGNKPDLVVMSGNRLTRNFRQAVEELALNWLGISDNRRVYLLDGHKEKQKAKSLLAQVKEEEWVEEEDTGVRIANLGLATCTVGSVLLIAVEHVLDQVKTLYLVSDKCDESEAIIALLNHLAREKECQESGILHQMLGLLHQVRHEAGIKAENAAFDSWFCIPWFIREVLGLGFARVVTKARENFNYTYDGQEYKLGQLWDLLDDSDFESHKYKGIEYQLASLKVEVNGIGLVKLLFMRHPTRRGNKMLQAVLLCTDTQYQNDQILRVYKLRWRIEVCYREVKQNHRFGQFHARNINTIYGQTLLSLVAYTFVTLFRLLVPPLSDQSLGDIVEDYLNVIVNLTFHDSGLVEIEFPKWLIYQVGLPDFSRLSAPT